MSKYTNLELLCDALNWQGGTIYQASDELSKYLNASTLISANSLLRMNENAMRVLIASYKTKKDMKESLAGEKK